MQKRTKRFRSEKLGRQMLDGILPRVIKDLDIISNSHPVVKVTRTCNVSDIK